MIKEIRSQDGHSFTVKGEFLIRCPNPEEYFAYDLINTWNLIYYVASFNDRMEEILNE